MREKMMSVEKTVTITTPQRQLTNAEAIAMFRKAPIVVYVLRNVVNDQLINCKPFDTMVDALNYRMTYLERDVAWVDQMEVK
jgi:hypothetical protein|tara:strand:+ start:1889 stop:2134 length:246 start_codon:yes stop_codon:yes gene_type:complete